MRGVGRGGLAPQQAEWLHSVPRQVLHILTLWQIVASCPNDLQVAHS